MDAKMRERLSNLDGHSEVRGRVNEKRGGVNRDRGGVNKYRERLSNLDGHSEVRGRGEGKGAAAYIVMWVSRHHGGANKNRGEVN